MTPSPATNAPEVHPATPGAPLERPSFEELFESEFAYVVHSLQRLGVPAADVDDVAHDVFLTVHRRLPTFDPMRPLRPWLFGVALRHVADFRKRAHRRREVSIAAPEELPDEGSGPESEASRRELRRFVLEALQGLDLDRRAVLILHDIDGQSAPEIAEALAIPLNTVYSRLRVARERFRERVRGLHDEGATP